MSHSENFVGHTTVQEVFDAIWCGETRIKGKNFDRMLAGTTSSFGHATTGIPYDLLSSISNKFLLI